MSKSYSNKFYYTLIIVSMLAVILFICQKSHFSIMSPNPYNSYTLQAKSWLEGRFDLGMNYSYLELAIYNDKYFVSFPPFPSFIMLPFTLIFGYSTPDNIITTFVSIMAAIYTFKLANLYIKNKNISFFISMFLCLASNAIFLSVKGWVWFIAQNISFALTICSFYYASTNQKNHSALSLFLLACAMGCRPFQATYIPLIFYLIYFKFKDDKEFNLLYLLKKLMISSIPAIVLGCVYMLLNYLRFGSIFEFGHNFLPEFLEAPNGQFSFSYIGNNMKTLFSLPTFENGTLAFGMFNGTAIWLVFPIIISYVVYLVNYVINYNNIEDRQNLFLILLIPFLVILHILLLCSHKTMGGYHFGHRYIIDCMPALVLGLILLIKEKGQHNSFLLNFPLLIFGLIINVYGTILYFSL